MELSHKILFFLIKLLVNFKSNFKVKKYDVNWDLNDSNYVTLIIP